MDAVKRYDELRKTMNMEDAITQLQVDILNDYEKYKFQKLSEQNENANGSQLETLVRQLPHTAYVLAMDCLQSTRYQTDAEFKQEVDDVLAITGVPERQSA
jgi:hypothetical protein